jgi:hypothetical protein
MSKAVQQTLDAKVFAPYQVSERKLSFGGSFTIEKKDLAEKGPGLEPDATYLFMVRGKLAGAAVKFGDDENSGTVSVKVTSLEKYEELEVADPLDTTPEKPADEPQQEDFEPSDMEAVVEAQDAINQSEMSRLDELSKKAVEDSKPKRGRKKKVEETITAGEPVFKDKPPLAGDLPAEEQSLSATAEAEILEQQAQVEPPEDDFPEPTNVVQMPTRDEVSSAKMPPCFSTHDDADEACQKCLDAEACRIATAPAE